MLGETHGNKQEYDWLHSLVGNREFAARIDDIVMEFGNSLYQPLVDQYVSGENIPLEEIQGAWRDTVSSSLGAPSPVYESLYKAVRESNIKRHGQHQIRVLCGDPNIDWKKIKTGADVWPYLSSRDQFYTQVVRTQVLDKHHRALLIMGGFHFLRNFQPAPGIKMFDMEHQLRLAGANPYLVVFGTNTTGSSGELDHRFDSWPSPVIVSLADNWVGDLPAISVVTGGSGAPRFIPKQKHPASGEDSFPSSPAPVLKLKNAADALLYLGPRDSLVYISPSPSELQGTAYGKEIERRQKIGASPLVDRTSENKYDGGPS